jgi:glucan-binding YG repeat protein
MGGRKHVLVKEEDISETEEDITSDSSETTSWSSSSSILAGEQPTTKQVRSSRRNIKPPNMYSDDSPGASGLQQQGCVVTDVDRAYTHIRKLGQAIRLTHLTTRRGWQWNNNHNTWYYKPAASTMKTIKQANGISSFAECDFGIAKAYLRAKFDVDYDHDADEQWSQLAIDQDLENHVIDPVICIDLHESAAVFYRDTNYIRIPLTRMPEESEKMEDETTDTKDDTTSTTDPTPSPTNKKKKKKKSKSSEAAVVASEPLPPPKQPNASPPNSVPPAPFPGTDTN